MRDRWTRRSVLATPLGLLAAALPQPSGANGGLLDAALWSTYKNRFVTRDGAVLDTGNANASHTEGQGYAMLLAVAYGDRPTFERLWAWTGRGLPRRRDGLFSWRRGADGRVADSNNATDGDLLIAWALVRAAKAWSDAGYRQAGLALAQAILDATVRLTELGPLMLPGVAGFDRPGGVIVVNPSYWVFPALRELDQARPDPLWGELVESGYRLLAGARFGQVGLPTDWVEVDGAQLRPARGFKPLYGFNAIRIPLYVAWLPGRQELLEPFDRFWRSYPGPAQVPAEIDVTNGRASNFPISAGGAASIGAVQARLRQPGRLPSLPGIGPDDDYYSATLNLLTRLMLVERGTG